MQSSREIRPARLEINLDNLVYNIRQIKEYIGKETLVMAIVKANAYGHGAIDASKIFLRNGADMLGVSIISEAIELRRWKIDAPILILNYTPPRQYEDIIRLDLTQTIYSYEDAKLLSNKAKAMDKEAIIHIKIDTGMGRLGFQPNEESIKDIIRISKLPNINIEGIFTHFATADERDKTYTKKQYNKFTWTVDRLKEQGISIAIKHIANSATIIDIPDYSLDMVRPGIILYGHYPSDEVRKERIKLKPAMSLKTSISNKKIVPKGSGISYNKTFTTSRESTIATLPLGYADGYSRILGENSEVCINGMKAPIVGRICMDQMMIDITDIEGEVEDVVLFGYGIKNCPTIEDIAGRLGTINYHIMCMMGRRLPRVYIEDGKIKHIVDYILD